MLFVGDSATATSYIITVEHYERQFGIQTFDAVMSPTPFEPINPANIERLLPRLTLVVPVMALAG